MATDPDYLLSRGFSDGDPASLERSLRLALADMEPLAYGDASNGLTREEQSVLREGGLTLESTRGEDPLARTAAKYAAIIERSLSTKEAGARLKLGEGRIRQMLVERALFSFLVDGTRHIPAFQFLADGRLVPNITHLNRALRPSMHPVGLYNWLHRPNEDLFLDDAADDIVTPIAWLAAGHDVERVVRLAERL